MSALDFLFGAQNKIGTPGINPAAKDPRMTQRSNLDEFLNKPGGSFLMNLLAQSGYSTMPQSPFSSIGKAALMTQQQGQGRERAGLENDLLRARIGLANKQTTAGVNPSAGNVQSQFITEDGKLGYLRRNGEVVITEQNVKDSYAIETLADGSKVGVNRANPSETLQVVTPDQARAATVRKSETEAGITLPADLSALDSTITKVDTTIEKIREAKGLAVDENVGIESRIRGDLPGFLGGGPRKLKQTVKSLQAEFGFDTLQKMRAASKTGGALGQVSERELDLLINALRSIDIEGDVDTLQANFDAVIEHYENYKREIEVMKENLRQQAGEGPDTSKPLSEMTDAELERIASGGNR